MTTSNEKEKLELMKRQDSRLMLIVIITLVVVPGFTLFCMMIAMREDYKDLIAHKNDQIRILQKVTHGCDRCSEQVQRSQRK